MKVKTMLEKLNKMNPEAEVRIGDYCGFPVLFMVSRLNDDKVVWMETEVDIDLATELQARFDNAAEVQMDELDFYTELLEIGITVDTIRRNLGNDKAEHMKTFCEEHGLI